MLTETEAEKDKAGAWLEHPVPSLKVALLLTSPNSRSPDPKCDARGNGARGDFRINEFKIKTPEKKKKEEVTGFQQKLTGSYFPISGGI